MRKPWTNEQKMERFLILLARPGGSASRRTKLAAHAVLLRNVLKQELHWEGSALGLLVSRSIVVNSKHHKPL